MHPFENIDAQARAAGLRFLVIGGQALNTYGSPRATLDVDLLIRATDRTAWLTILGGEGFRIKHDGGNFLQLSPPYGVPWPLDLMLVNQSTFDNLAERARMVDCCGVKARVPAPEHIIALKLHALVHGPSSRMEKDFPDIVRLGRMCGMDSHSAEIRDIFKRYGTDELYERFQRAVKARP